jgi:hypothetical protein
MIHISIIRGGLRWKDQRGREFWSESEHRLELLMHDIDELCAAVMYQPTDCWVHLGGEVPIEQNRHIRQPETSKQSMQRTRERERENARECDVCELQKPDELFGQLSILRNNVLSGNQICVTGISVSAFFIVE